MDEIQVDKPADERPEVTNEQLAAQLEAVGQLVGMLALALGGYPIDGKQMQEQIERMGLRFDPSKLGANQRRIVMPSGPFPPPIKGS